MKIKLFLLSCGLGIAAPVFAATTTGTITATLTLTTGCLVNGQPAISGVNFGTLNFGPSSTMFSTLTATLLGTSGNGIFVNCSTGASYNVQLTSSNAKPATVFGTASLSAPRYLLSGSDNTKGITYTLYSTASYTTPIVNGTNLVPSGTTDPILGINYAIYGQITGGGNNAAIPADTYTDVIGVAVNY